MDPGFDMSGVTVASFEPESWGYAPPKAREFYRTLRERAQRIPGVAAVSLAGRLPLTMGSSPDDITLDDGSLLTVHTASVDVDYFPVLRLPLVEGRAFLPADTDAAPPVAVVNETLARRLRADGRALDQTFRFRDARVRIVGIAEDAKYASLDERTPPFAYFPLAQHWQPTQSLLVRARPGGAPVAAALREAVLSIDPLLPPPRIATLEQATAFVLLPQRAAAVVTGVLGAAGLLLASVGLYGTIAFAASRRTRELGIRVALGATPSSLSGMVLREGLWLSAAGIVIGVPLAAASTRLLSAWLFGVSPLDPGTFVLMSAVLVAIGAAASYLPARRAAALDPVSALRAD
jgi:predicted permease